MADSLRFVAEHLPFPAGKAALFVGRYVSFLACLFLASSPKLLHAEETKVPVAPAAKVAAGEGRGKDASTSGSLIGAEMGGGNATSSSLSAPSMPSSPRKPSSPPSSATLPDPTRPPASLAVEESKDPASMDIHAGAANGLQTVILRKGRKPVAVINGESVELGGKLGDARLVKVSETEAVLQGENGREVFRLTPGIERKNILPPVVKKSSKHKVSKKIRKTSSQPSNK